MFITDANFDGDLNGTSGADSLCNSDANKPSGGGTYKAMISTSSRIAMPSVIDWVLKANQEYIDTNGDTIGTTNSNAVFDFPLENPITGFGHDNWTGLTSTWEKSSDTCQDFTSGLGIDHGISGYAAFDTTDGAINGYNPTCNTSRGIVCVEQ